MMQKLLTVLMVFQNKPSPKTKFVACSVVPNVYELRGYEFVDQLNVLRAYAATQSSTTYNFDIFTKLSTDCPALK